MDLPIPKFVELVETNPDVTSAFALHLRPFDRLTNRGAGHRRLRVSSVELGP